MIGLRNCRFTCDNPRTKTWRFGFILFCTYSRLKILPHLPTCLLCPTHSFTDWIECKNTQTCFGIQKKSTSYLLTWSDDHDSGCLSAENGLILKDKQGAMWSRGKTLSLGEMWRFAPTSPIVPDRNKTIATPSKTLAESLHAPLPSSAMLSRKRCSVCS